MTTAPTTRVDDLVEGPNQNGFLTPGDLILLSSIRLVLPGPGWNQTHVHRFELKLRLVRIRGEIRLGGFQPVLVVALEKIGLIVSAAGFVTHVRALGNDSRQLQHVVELAGEDE